MTIADTNNQSDETKNNEEAMNYDTQTLEPEVLDTEPMFSMEAAIATILQECSEDKNAAFRPDNLRILAHLQNENPAAYEKMRDELQKYKIVGRLDAAVAAQRKVIRVEANAGAKSQTGDLLTVASAAEYFRDADDIPFADIIGEDGYRQTWAVTGEGFKRWLRGEYYRKNKASISSEAFNTAINTLAARAVTEGAIKPVALRCGRLDGKIYIDLCNDKWQAIEVSVDGYRIVDNPPLRFRRRKGMKALPVPESGGSIIDLRRFVNVPNEQGFILIVSWLLAALSGHGPFPVLIVVGEQGTSKSTLMSLLRQLVDPNSAPLRTLPREVRDLFIAANSAWVLAFDNLSNMKDWISDALCRLATGGGFATRTLYTDEDEMLFDAMRPIMMNGIENVAPRGDLIDRAIVLMLEPIAEESRKTAKEIQADFDAAAPRILGALLDMMVHGLGKLPETKLERPPRMADFALWATACETAVWSKSAFIDAYETNRAEANQDIIAASVLATAVYEFMQGREEPWIGTATDLLTLLRTFVPDDNVLRDKHLWPSTSRVLSERLRRVASALRRIGVEVAYERGDKSVRHICLSRAAPNAQKPATCATAPAKPGDNADDAEIAAEVAEASPERNSKLTKRSGSKGKSQVRKSRTKRVN